MKRRVTATWAKQFERECRDWQVRLGLTDWAITFARAESTEEDEAEVAYSCANRSATMTSMLGAPNPSPPGRVALHEMLHLLLADPLHMAAKRGKDTHADVVRDEHRAIERLMDAMLGAHP